jgi:stage V sporulation protein K
MPENYSGVYGYRLLDNHTAVITGYIGKDKHIKTPEHIDGHYVSAIGDYAFAAFDSTLEIIEVSENIQSVGEFAFAWNKKLIEISFSNASTIIKGNAFSSCISLTRVFLPKALSTISECLFYECKSLQSLTIPATVGAIEEGAFQLCRMLDNVVLPTKVRIIKYRVFAYCDSLRHIALPGVITSIGQQAFYQCGSLKEIRLPDSVSEIGDDAFSCCSSLESISLPSALALMGSGVFFKCAKLDVINLADSNEKFALVGNTLFNKASKQLLYYPASCQSSVFRIPKGTISLGIKAFSGNPFLTTVSFPASIRNICASAFFGCDSLTNLSFYENNSSYYLDNGVLFDKIKNELVYYPSGLNDKCYSIPQGVISIGDSAFERSKLISVSIPNSVRAIRDSAFWGCKDLVDLVIPDSVRDIGKNAFISLTKLVRVSLPNSLPCIRERSFLLCGSLQELVIPRSVQSIYRQAFRFCHALRSIYIPREVTSIAEDAFENCENIVMLVEDNSYAKSFAAQHKIKFKLADYAKPDSKYAVASIQEPAHKESKTQPVSGGECLDKELDPLIGLGAIKDDVRNLIGLVRMQRMRAAKGLGNVPVSLHLVFTGNPGTGKTTVARILARIYKDIGVLKTGQLIEVDRADLVAEYVGQTAPKTRKKIEEAFGGILFIDEAYTLSKGGNDYGQEAIDTLLKSMEDNRDVFIVIVAGYKTPMEKFINSNPGLKSRFNKYFDFQDYSDEELIRIFHRMCGKYDYKLEADAKIAVESCIRAMVQKKGDNFANAREIRNLFENIITRQSSRLAYSPNPNSLDMITIRRMDVD